MATLHDRIVKSLHQFFLILLLVSSGSCTIDEDGSHSSRVGQTISDSNATPLSSETFIDYFHGKSNPKESSDKASVSRNTNPMLKSCDDYTSMPLHIPHVDINCKTLVNCSCGNDRVYGQVVDCSKRNITEIPQFPKETSVLLLSRNQIKSIKDGAFKNLKYLKYLDMSQNELQNLTNGSFHGLEGLCVLKLTGNQIKYTNVTIPESTFRDLNNLIYLEFQQNLDEQFPEEMYPSIALSALTELQFLHIDGLNNRPFQVEFQNLSKLSNLSLIGEPYRRCKMKTIEKDMFVNFPFLKSLTVVNCYTTRVENGSFAELHWLNSLDLSYNTELTFASLPNITFALRGRTMYLLNLTKIHKTFGDCTNLKANDLQYMTKMTIKNFIIDSNRLSVMKRDAVDNIPKLTGTLSVKDNLLLIDVYIISLLTHHNLTNLSSLILADQTHNHNLSELWPLYNQDFNKKSNQNTERLVETTVLKPSGKRRIMKRWSEQNCSTCINNFSIPYPVPQNLQHLDMSNMKARYPLQRICVCEPNSLRSLDVHRNIFYSIEGSILGLTKLEWVDFSWNFCEYISPNVLHELPGLKFLNLSYNYLGSSFKLDRHGDIFSQQSRLRTLDLTENRIRAFNSGFFSGLINLEKLILRDNFLAQFEVNLQTMKKLNHINLRHNLLFQFSDYILHEFEHLAVNNLTIDLYKNNLSCSCKHLNLLKWMSNSKINFQNLKDYSCIDENGESRNMSSPHELYAELFEYCKSYTLLIFISSAIFVLALTVITVCIVYRYRWNLRYIYYSGKMRMKGYIPIKDDGSDFDHDVFVSFANEDNSFVRDFAIPELEEKRHLRLLLHDRDFRPGEFVHDNIVKAICTSKKTLIVMSDAFLQSVWCRFEMHMARMEAIKTERNVLTVVLLKDVPTAGLPLEIVDIIRQKTYLEFPHEDAHREQFWDRLFEALK
ncbi:toll-like receptor 4 [Ruditapes philippinarum]|uniref:toll-like receptor 4 n=1 Tax=Ruditapes philippinarum TaxID=129788 RepID=UPI00295AA602|nr:toll-like receptor 4 [Ruditapes philippinarum]